MSPESWTLVALSMLAALGVVFVRRRAALVRAPTPPPGRAIYPSLSVIHPVRGLDVGFAENVAAALGAAYPGPIEHVFVFDDEEEPALPIVREAIAALASRGEGDRARVVIAGPPRPGYTGKLSAMNAGMAASRGELVAFLDSDIRVDRELLRVVVDRLLDDPAAGSAFAPVVVSEPAATAGDLGYQIMLNSLYSPEVALWDRQRRPLRFIMGQLMVFRRATLEAIGSVDCARGQLVDDMHIGTHVVAAGLANVMTSQPARIVEGGMSFAEFARAARRWLVFSRSGIPGAFAVGAAFPFVAFWVGLLSAALSASTLVTALGAILMVAVSAEILALNRATGAPSAPPRLWWMAPFMLFTGPFVYATTWFWPEVRWRGRVYELNARAELDTHEGGLGGKIRRVLRAHA